MHTDDVYYNFDMTDDKCAQFSEQDFQVAYDMASFIVNFALTGNPNSDNKDVRLQPAPEYEQTFSLSVPRCHQFKTFYIIKTSPSIWFKIPLYFI